MQDNITTHSVRLLAWSLMGQISQREYYRHVNTVRITVCKPCLICEFTQCNHSFEIMILLILAGWWSQTDQEYPSCAALTLADWRCSGLFVKLYISQSVASCASWSINRKTIHTLLAVATEVVWGDAGMKFKALKCDSWPQTLLRDTEDEPPVRHVQLVAKCWKWDFLNRMVMPRGSDSVGSESFSSTDLF